MIKPIFSALGLVGLFTGSYFGSTELGLRSEGWHEVSFEVPGRPSFDAVGQNLYTPDGTKLIVTAISHGKGGGHVVEANVRVTNRLALCLFPTRMEQSYALDRKAVERVVLQATGYAPGRFEPSEKEWVVVN